jgi:hypothetical protein
MAMERQHETSAGAKATDNSVSLFWISPPTQVPEDQEKELADALMELLIEAATETCIHAEPLGGPDESETTSM